MFDACGQGMKQSPINLEVSEAVYKDSLTDIQLRHKADRAADKMYISNNGHTGRRTQYHVGTPRCFFPLFLFFSRYPNSLLLQKDLSKLATGSCKIKVPHLSPVTATMCGQFLSFYSRKNLVMHIWKFQPRT